MSMLTGQPNIVFIIIDALRIDKLGCYGNGKGLSPNLDNFAKDGVLFENVNACINTTDPSLTTIFSGMRPASHGIIHHGEYVTEGELDLLEESGVKFLPELLKSHGYKTLAVDWFGRWHKRGYDYYSGESLGFLSRVRQFITRKKELINLLPKPIFKLILRLIPQKLDDAKCLTNQAINLLKKNRDEKFFLFIHYWDTHTPYGAPIIESDKSSEKEVKRNLEEIKQIINPKRREYIRHLIESNGGIKQIKSRYDRSIEFVDKEIGRLLNVIKNGGLWEKTLIIITADHGESLDEHGIFFDHHGLYDVCIHVPLIMFHPSFPKKKIRGFVQHTDLMPTILDILGSDASGFDGASLLPLMHGDKELYDRIYAQESHTETKFAVRTKKYKFIYASSKEDAVCRYCGYVHGGMEELYDLENDPNELKNIIDKRSDIADKLRKDLFENLIRRNNIRMSSSKIP